MKGTWWNPRLGPLSTVLILFMAHLVLREVMARCDIVSCLFSAGPTTAPWMIVTAGVFVAIRLLTCILIPALLAWWTVTRLLTRLWPDPEA